MKKSALFIPVAAAAAAMFLFSSLSEEPEPIRVETAEAVTTSRLISVSGDGTLEAYRVRRLGVRGYAEAERIYLNVGDEVAEGQVIMTLRPADEPASALEELVSETDLASLLDGGAAEGSVFADALAERELVSPFDGVLTRLSVAEGEQASPFEAIAEVSDVSRIRARVRLGEEYTGLVEVGMPASVTSGGVKYDAVVIEVSPVVRGSGGITGTSARYCEAVLELYSPDGAVPGASASAVIYAERRTGMLLLPFEAIGQDKNDREYVYVLADGTARLCYVTSGEEFGAQVEILSGVAPGETVIVSAEGELYNGAPVEAEG